MANEQLILELLQEVRNDIRNLADRAQHFDDDLMRHSAESEARHVQILSAFPNKDLDGHRRYHETVIEWRELRNKIVRECLVNAAKAGSLIAAGWLLYAIFVALKMEITRG